MAPCEQRNAMLRTCLQLEILGGRGCGPEAGFVDPETISERGPLPNPGPHIDSGSH
jgi:hypothetical protein